MPLHDTRYEMDLVRQRMSEIDVQMRAYGEVGAGLSDYALGRAHLALHEWKPAYVHLAKAQAIGLTDLELHYALARVLGEIYSAELEAARNSGDKNFFIKQEQELQKQYLVPALAHLNKSRGLKTVSASNVQGLLDFYQRNYEGARLHATLAQRQAPWQYEAIKLEGDVYMMRALEQRDHGDYEAAEQSFEQARRCYERTSEHARSDATVHEALAECWIRQMELDGLRGQDPRARLVPALAAAERALVASPEASSGATKKAFAYLFAAQELESRGLEAELRAMTDRLIEQGEQAVRLHPDDVYSHDALGNGYVFRARYAMIHKQEYASVLALARTHFIAAISINQKFPWAYNDLGRAYLVEGEDLLSKHVDSKQVFLMAITAFKNATFADNDYLFGYSNMAATYALMSRHEMELGKDPSAWLEKLEKSASSSFRINDKFITSHGSMVLGTLIKAFYDLDALNNDLNSVIKTQNHIRSFIKIRSDIPTVYQHLALTHYIIARQKINNSADPSQAIQDGLRALETCQALSQGLDGTCASVEALLLALTAQQQARLGLSPISSLEKVSARAGQAVLRAPADTDVLLIAAEAIWRAARVRLAGKMAAAKEIESGLAVIDKTLSLAPTWPRALAIKGAILVLKAQSAKGEFDRNGLLARARPLLVQAQEGNPLLRNVYAEAFREVETLK